MTQREKSLVLTIFNPGVIFIILFDQKREAGYSYYKWKLPLEIILSIISPTVLYEKIRDKQIPGQINSEITAYSTHYLSGSVTISELFEFFYKHTSFLNSK